MACHYERPQTRHGIVQDKNKEDDIRTKIKNMGASECQSDRMGEVSSWSCKKILCVDVDPARHIQGRNALSRQHTCDLAEYTGLDLMYYFSFVDW